MILKHLLILPLLFAPVFAQDAGVTFQGVSRPSPVSGSHGVNFPGGITNYCYIEVFNDPAGKYFRDTEAWTFLAWIRVESTADDRALISQWTTTVNEKQVLIRSDADGTPPTNIECNFSDNNPCATNDFLNIDEWHLYAITNSTGNAGIQYLYDSSCVQEISAAFTKPTDATGTSRDLIVGTRWDESSIDDPMLGDMAYVLYVEGTEFTQTQVENFCADAEAEGALHDSNTIFFYHFDGEYLDSSSAGNDGVERLGGSGACSFNTSGGPYE